MTRPGGYRQEQPRQQIPQQGQTRQIPLEDIIQNGDAQKLVEWADRIGDQLKKDKLKTSQIRRVFTEVRSIEAEAKARAEPGTADQSKRNVDIAVRRLVLLKPKLAYQAGRHKGALIGLKDILEPAIDVVQKAPDREKAVGNFVRFFEAILAYHKFHGGEDY